MYLPWKSNWAFASAMGPWTIGEASHVLEFTHDLIPNVWIPIEFPRILVIFKRHDHGVHHNGSKDQSSKPVVNHQLHGAVSDRGAWGLFGDYTKIPNHRPGSWQRAEEEELTSIGGYVDQHLLTDLCWSSAPKALGNIYKKIGLEQFQLLMRALLPPPHPCCLLSYWVWHWDAAKRPIREQVPLTIPSVDEVATNEAQLQRRHPQFYEGHLAFSPQIRRKNNKPVR